jgi:hypothetical protein
MATDRITLRCVCRADTTHLKAYVTSEPFPGAACSACGTWIEYKPDDSAPASVIGEAVLADSVRTEAPRVPTHALPQDSAERKRTPLCTGLLDYAPDALQRIVDVCGNCGTFEDGLEAEILTCLAKRGDNTCGQYTFRGAFYALLMLESELGGGPEDREWEYHDWSTCHTLVELFDLVPRALAAVAQVSWHGNEKHNPGQALHHAREKSTDHADCILRHLVERGGFDGPFRHSAAQVWRWLIMGQLELEAHGAPKARGAR